MEAFLQIISIVLPAGAVLFGMYLTVQTFLNKQLEKELVSLKNKSAELVLPTRLQAYERIALLLERISPSNMVIRVNEPEFTAGMLQQRLLLEVRQEFNHNLSQQIYMSDEAWALVKASVQEVNKAINTAALNCDPEAKGIELAKVLFQYMMELPEDPIVVNLAIIKAEVQKIF